MTEVLSYEEYVGQGGDWVNLIWRLIRQTALNRRFFAGISHSPICGRKSSSERQIDPVQYVSFAASRPRGLYTLAPASPYPSISSRLPHSLDRGTGPSRETAAGSEEA